MSNPFTKEHRVDPDGVYRFESRAGRVWRKGSDFLNQIPVIRNHAVRWFLVLAAGGGSVAQVAHSEGVGGAIDDIGVQIGQVTQEAKPVAGEVYGKLKELVADMQKWSDGDRNGVENPPPKHEDIIERTPAPTPEPTMTASPVPTATTEIPPTPLGKPVPTIERLMLTESEFNGYLSEVGGLSVNGDPASYSNIVPIWGEPNEGSRWTEEDGWIYMGVTTSRSEAHGVKQVGIDFPINSKLTYTEGTGTTITFEDTRFTFTGGPNSYQQLNQLFTGGEGYVAVVFANNGSFNATSAPKDATGYMLGNTQR